MCLACSHPQDLQLWCHQRADETAAKTYSILSALSRARHWWTVRRYWEGNSL